MTLIGLDLNASRARTMQGDSHAAGLAPVPVALALDAGERDLPLAVSLEERQPLVGRAGAGLCRKSPHLACLDFLPFLGDGRTWEAGRHRLDACGALALTFDHLQRRFGRPDGVAVAVPAYLSPAQVGLLANLAVKARWPLLGSVPAPVAVALAAHDCLPWSGLAIVVDLDGHALTWSVVAVGDDTARLLLTHPARQLGRGAWLCRLLDSVAHRCVRLSRRDPRESAETEQCLYDQLAQMLETLPSPNPLPPGGEGRVRGLTQPSPPQGGEGRVRGADCLAELVLQTPHWYQHLMFPPAELADFCAPLLRQGLAEMQTVLAATATLGPVGAVLLTASAARLPGLAAGLSDLILPAETEQPAGAGEDADFGESLIPEEQALAARVHVLDDDAVARAACDLAVRQHRRELPRGHLESVPLPAGAGPGERGPARLSFRGEEHVLSGLVFTLGRDPACDLVFESELYPTVSARHCEIVLDRGAYLLRDRSRHGTLVNDCPVTQPVALHSGDWIRLGPSGPVLRFLGQPNDRLRLAVGSW